MTRPSFLLHKAQQRYSSGVFINTPEPDFDPSETLTLLTETYTSPITPFFSIVVPIHNQAAVIRQNLDAILRHTTGKPYELLVILDACSDTTEEAVTAWTQTIKTPDLCVGLLVFKSTQPLFETAADNLGFFCARGEYVLEIQADMQMTETAYNMRLLKPFELKEVGDRMLGVSGRCGHGLVSQEAVGRAGTLIESPLPPDFPRGVFFLTETCNRGPLLLHRGRMIEMGFLDERHFFLDNSDHDLFARAFVERGYLCGFVGIDFSSPLSQGSTRKPRDPVNQRFYDLCVQRCRFQESLYAEYLRQGRLPHRPIRAIPLT
jgi:hypothetical protein